MICSYHEWSVGQGGREGGRERERERERMALQYLEFKQHNGPHLRNPDSLIGEISNVVHWSDDWSNQKV